MAGLLIVYWIIFGVIYTWLYFQFQEDGTYWGLFFGSVQFISMVIIGIFSGVISGVMALLLRINKNNPKKYMKFDSSGKALVKPKFATHWLSHSRWIDFSARGTTLQPPPDSSERGIPLQVSPEFDRQVSICPKCFLPNSSASSKCSNCGAKL